MEEGETLQRQNFQASWYSLGKLVFFRPGVRRQKVGKISTVGKAESSTEIVTLAAVTFKVLVHAGEKAEKVMIWLPHALKELKFFTYRH